MTAMAHAKLSAAIDVHICAALLNETEAFASTVLLMFLVCIAAMLQSRLTMADIRAVLLNETEAFASTVFPQTMLAWMGLLLALYRNSSEFQDCWSSAHLPSLA